MSSSAIAAKMTQVRAQIAKLEELRRKYEALADTINQALPHLSESGKSMNQAADGLEKGFTFNRSGADKGACRDIGGEFTTVVNYLRNTILPEIRRQIARIQTEISSLRSQLSSLQSQYEAALRSEERERRSSSMSRSSTRRRS